MLQQTWELVQSVSALQLYSGLSHVVVKSGRGHCAPARNGGINEVIGTKPLTLSTPGGDIFSGRSGKVIIAATAVVGTTGGLRVEGAACSPAWIQQAVIYRSPRRTVYLWTRWGSVLSLSQCKERCI